MVTALGTEVVSSCDNVWLSSVTVDAVGEEVPNILSDLTLSFCTKLPWAGWSVADSIEETYIASLES